ncbi:putative nicotianamine synthase 3 [Erysiphe necator]|uniref:Putative nicotianamine synthase 3 n=1 Tax=Uncinula necator TaxID=52586 RepID=A0A0B1NZS2_UNCNE|nr:putative nicotianamine synthase 3 [Erysiphe necator]
MFEILLHYWHRIVDLWCGSEEACDENIEVNILIKKILFIHGQMVSLRESESFNEIADLFSEIRLICTRPISDRASDLILKNPRIIEITSDLRSFCSAIETNLEKKWSLKAAGDVGSTQEEVCARIRAYPYFNTYVNLIEAELSAMRSIEQKPIKKIAFIGSGAMPMTSLCLIGRLTDTPTNISVLNIDRDAEALELSKVVCERLGSQAEGMEFCHAEAGTSLDLNDCDAVYLAALVGHTQEQKEALLGQVTSKMRPGALLVTRGGRKLRSLIYTVFDPTTERVSNLLDVALVINPNKHNIVNSIFVGRVKQSLTSPDPEETKD